MPIFYLMLENGLVTMQIAISQIQNMAKKKSSHWRSQHWWFKKLKNIPIIN